MPLKTKLGWLIPMAIIVGICSAGALYSPTGNSFTHNTLVSPALAQESTTANDAGELFAPVATVLRHPRCMNCHPRGDRPRQGNDRHLHIQNIVRGPDNFGFFNQRCYACHREENNTYSGVPGAPQWHLAPRSMGWEGLSDADLCTTLKDMEKNGGKDVAELVKHMTDDPLVLWGWKPGGNRTPVSPPHEEFVKQLNAWADAGAPCPQTASNTNGK